MKSGRSVGGGGCLIFAGVSSEGDGEGDSSPPHLPLSSYLLPPPPGHDRPAIPACSNLNFNLIFPANNKNSKQNISLFLIK